MHKSCVCVCHRSACFSLLTVLAQTEANIKRLVASIGAYSEANARVRYFGIVCGISDVEHWTERSACYVLIFLNKLMALKNPGARCCASVCSRAGACYVTLQPETCVLFVHLPLSIWSAQG